MHDPSNLRGLTSGASSLGPSAFPLSSPLRSTSPYRADRLAPAPSASSSFPGFSSPMRSGAAGGDGRSRGFPGQAGSAATVGRGLGSKKGPGGVQQLLGNEEAKRESVKTIIRFLCYSGFPQQLSPKVFVAPPRNLLVEIWNHLLRRACDDSVQVTNENANEEVPRLFKELGSWLLFLCFLRGPSPSRLLGLSFDCCPVSSYPLTIAKSSMQAPNSAHQWPLHLHALSWLCELLIYESEVFSRDPLLNPAVEKKDAMAGAVMISRMLLNHYPQSGNGRDLTQLQQVLYSQMEREVEQLERSIASRERHLNRAQQELRSISAELEANAALPPEIDRLCADLEKLNDGIKQQKTASDQQDKEIDAKQKRRSALQTEIRQVAAETEHLDAQVKEQGISKAEVEKIRSEIHALREKVALRSKDVEAQKLQLTSVEDEINRRGEELRITTRTGNTLLQRCMQDTESAKFPSDAAWASLDRFATTASLPADSDSPSSSLGASARSRSDGRGRSASQLPLADGRERGGRISVTSATDSPLATHEQLLGVRWKAWKAELLRLVDSDRHFDAQSRRTDEKTAAEIEKLKKTRQQLESARRTEERKISVLREDLLKVEAQRTQQHQVLSAEIETLERGVSEHRQAVEAALLKAERHANDLRLLFETREKENEAEIAEKLDDLRRIQEDGLSEKRRILHALQDLVQKKEQVCVEYERDLVAAVARSEKYTQSC
ncbi:putative HEC/Ndc80p family protein [Neospora caninum Liverpool]|uniref:Kinetochore protein NDC80 n=1 Tax=Neospora caninum (strain Liverpool) TaxID=572307 RepID=F0VGN0_NEOCL|nr:putative HEC/Ndc80p family protein [Neospora caninum Liverpool]CBZ52874.1 putative HEC/Ndc80p family protein [Neospora caninum Liverpool]|eukprot:XP_003882906.1 putative HEC/Ndc80p family protein [Neospora caninum Liverpool]